MELEKLVEDLIDIVDETVGLGHDECDDLRRAFTERIQQAELTDE
jgi:hypothetical protein